MYTVEFTDNTMEITVVNGEAPVLVSRLTVTGVVPVRYETRVGPDINGDVLVTVLRCARVITATGSEDLPVGRMGSNPTNWTDDEAGLIVALGDIQTWLDA